MHAHLVVENGLGFPRLELSAEQISLIDILDGESGGEQEGDAGKKKKEDIQKTPTKKNKERAKGTPAKTKPASITKEPLGTSRTPLVTMGALQKPPKILSRTTATLSVGTGGGTPQKDDWRHEDVRQYRGHDFDFQANLDRFDKEKIFKEIRASDDAKPEDRLVAHNARKLRSDENVLEKNFARLGLNLDHGQGKGRFGDENEGNQITLTSSKDTLMQPQHPKAFSPNFYPAADVQSIEQQLLHSGALTMEQMIENAGRSLADFLFCEISREALFSAKDLPIILRITVDRAGAYALCCGKVLLNRGLRVEVFVSGDLQRAPVYFNQALRQFQTCGGTLCVKLSTDTLILITSMPKGVEAKEGTIVIALTPCDAPATWHIRFGLPHDIGGDLSQYVLCDIGWPSNMVNQLLANSQRELRYESIFGLATYVKIKGKC